jgi:hypothetical protein
VEGYSELFLASPNWFSSHEYIAIWLEGLALVAIFIWDRIDAGEQHKQTLAQMEAMQLTAKAAQKSAEVAETSLKIAERADVLLDSAGLSMNVPGVSQNRAFHPLSQVILTLKNFGRTRAENVKCRIGLLIPGVPESVPPREPFDLGPGGTQNIVFENFKQTLSHNTFLQIADGVIALRFAGEVDYYDIFGTHHNFTCKGILDSLTGTFLMGDVDPRKDKK